jgi:hypothetical protein
MTAGLHRILSLCDMCREERIHGVAISCTKCVDEHHLVLEPASTIGEGSSSNRRRPSALVPGPRKSCTAALGNSDMSIDRVRRCYWKELQAKIGRWLYVAPGGGTMRKRVTVMCAEWVQVSEAA